MTLRTPRLTIMAQAWDRQGGTLCNMGREPIAPPPITLCPRSTEWQVGNSCCC